MVLDRDARADGQFWYGVATTSIYCRPQCPSRRPKPENTRFFMTPEAARAAGLPTYTIEDAGRTEVEPGTRTVTAIGPAPKALLDAITGPKGSHACRLLA